MSTTITTDRKCATPAITVGAPKAPTGVSAAPAGPHTVTVHWTAPADNGAGCSGAAKEFADTETILDRLDVRTAGGIKDVLDAIHGLGKPPSAPQSSPTQDRQPD